jgi:hypothetical protein
MTAHRPSAMLLDLELGDRLDVAKPATRAESACTKLLNEHRGRRTRPRAGKAVR